MILKTRSKRKRIMHRKLIFGKVCEVIKIYFHSTVSFAFKEISNAAQFAKKELRDTYERRIDACLVIQVAGNDFTSSNLRLYTSELFHTLESYVADFYCHIASGMSGK